MNGTFIGSEKIPKERLTCLMANDRIGVGVETTETGSDAYVFQLILKLVDEVFVNMTYL